MGIRELKLTDVHCHILFGVDDGSKSLEQSNKMLGIAYNEGIRTIILTPHYNKRVWGFDVNVWQERYDALVKLAGENYPGLRIYIGCEIYYHSDTIEELNAGKIPTMAGGKYVLVEFDTSISYRRLAEAVMGIMQSDHIPIIAHVERYECILEDPDRVEELKDFGAYIQVNVSGVMGNHGRLEKKCIKKLLKKELVNFIATDAHRDDKRAPYIRDCADYVTKKYGYEYAERIFRINPRCVITNNYIEE